MDIIFAAVPANKPSARCEILRIENYNYTRNYRTYTSGLYSDITTSDGNPLYAHYDANASQGSHSTVKFSVFKSIQVLGSIASAGGYARRADYSKKYEDMRTIFTGIPVKTSLKFSGWAAVEGGIEKYVWSVDYGKTWHDFTEKQASLSNLNFGTDQRKNWYDGQTATEVIPKGVFTLSVPLEEYVGQVVDVMVAVKPNYSSALCPIGRVDNVAVYGENNSFYTKLLSVNIAGNNITPTYFDVGGDPLNMVSKNVDSGKLAQWDIGYGANNAYDFAYTMFEPYNVNALNTRMYTNVAQEISNGTTVSIDGYVACSGGVQEYMYTLNGGDDWTTISRTEEYALHSGGQTNAKKTDSTFDGNDFSNGNFSSSNNGANLEFNISSNATIGEEKTLLVVAKSTAGKIYPVFSVRLKFIG